MNGFNDLTRYLPYPTQPSPDRPSNPFTYSWTSHTVTIYILFWFCSGFSLEPLERWRLRHYLPLKHWEPNTQWCGMHSRRTEISTTLKEHSAFIFKVKWYCWTSFKMSGNSYRLTWRYVTADLTTQQHHCENLKSAIGVVAWSPLTESNVQ